MRAFVRSLVRALSRPDIGCMYMRCDVYCSEVGYERVSYISLHWFSIRKFPSRRGERGYADEFPRFGVSYLRFYEFRRTRGTIERLSIPGKSRSTYFIFYELVNKRKREREKERKGAKTGEKRVASPHSHPFPHLDIYLRLDCLAGLP